MLQSYFLSVLSLSSFLVYNVEGYGTGVPKDACDSMEPGQPHRPNQVTAAEAKKPPFELQASTEKDGSVEGKKLKCFQ